MFCSKVVLFFVTLSIAAIASAQVMQQSRPARSTAAVPCRLVPAIVTNVYGERDYGLQLMINKQPFKKGPLDKARAEMIYSQLLKQGLCIPPKQPLRCVVVSAPHFRRGIEVRNYDGTLVTTLVNSLNETSPEKALSNYFTAGICN